MNILKFLKDFEESVGRDALVDAVYDEMAQFCEDEGIKESDLSTEMLEELAEGVVTRGLSVESQESLEAHFRYLTSEELEMLKQHRDDAR